MKLAHIISALILSVSFLFIQAHPHHDKDKRVYEVEDFHSLELNGSYEVILTQSNERKVMIEASEVVHDAIRVDVRNGVLIFKMDTKNAILKKTKIYISNPDFEEIHIKGAGNLWSTTGIKGEDLDILASGTADVDLDVNVENLDATIHGAGNIKLRGNAYTSSMNIDGAGGIRAFSLNVDDLELELNGAGSAQVHANDELDVEIRGVGKVVYEGDPNLHKDIAGLGRLKRR